eukprot:3928932-Pyramimonas_sp.AAC.1
MLSNRSTEPWLRDRRVRIIHFRGAITSLQRRLSIGSQYSSSAQHINDGKHSCEHRSPRMLIYTVVNSPDAHTPGMGRAELPAPGGSPGIRPTVPPVTSP